MYETNSEGPQLSRRRFLAMSSLAGGTVIPGCVGDSDGDTDGNGESANENDGDRSQGDTDGSDENDDGSSGGGDPTDYDCGNLAGSPTPVDPGDRSFVFLFDYPDTWEVYNDSISDSKSAIGAFVGHTATSRTATYPINIYLNYTIQPTDDREALETWQRPSFLDHEAIGEFEFEGETVDIVAIEVDEKSRELRMILPSPSSDGFHRLKLMRSVGNDYISCADAADAVAMDVLESLRPNPDYTP